MDHQQLGGFNVDKPSSRPAAVRRTEIDEGMIGPSPVC